MIPYILHVTVITTVCFLFYKLLLQKETFYRLNRWTLLSCVAVSFTLPLLPVPREWSWRDKWKERAAEVAIAPEQAGEGGQPLRLGGQPGQKAALLADALPLPAAVNQELSGHRAHRSGETTVVQEPTAADEQPFVHGQRVVHEPGIVHEPTATHGPAVAHEPRVDQAMAAVSGIGEAGDKSSKTTTGTPAGKNGAGTLARFFSGALLLLAVQWLFYVYLLGVVIFGAGFLLQLGVLLYQSYARPVIKDGRYRIVEISGDRAPCSFGNTIFINPERYDWETYNQILIHEKIHVSGRHTLDIVVAEIALVIQWFNPFAWLYRREVENNLEFLTDAHVLLDASIERSAYQLSLLRVSAPHLSFSLTNNYNQSLLKRRIVMMNSQSSSRRTVWKYFFLLPLFTGLMCALNKPAIALGEATTKLSMTPLFGLVTPVVDTVKKPAGTGDTASAAGRKPASRVRVEGGSDEGSGAAVGYGNVSGDGDAYGPNSAVTIAGDNEANPQAIKAMVDAYNQAYSAPALADLSPLDVKLKVNVDAGGQMKLWGGDVYSSANDTVPTDGAWYATSYGDRLSFELKAGDEDHNWDYTLHVDKSEITPFPGQGNVSFKLVREAGTVEFKGQFDGEEGFGHFHFTPDAAYFPALKQLGVEDIEDRRLFGFFALNIKKDYVNMLTHNGYPHISQRDLLSLAAMHVDEAFIQYWKGANFGDGEGGSMDPRTLIRLKALHIDRAYVDELKAAGYDHLSLRDLETLKAQHIDKAYIQSMGHGANNEPIPVRELVSYKAMHIDSAYLQGLRKLGYDNLSTRDVTSLYSLHVTPEFIGQLQALGYKELTARDLMNLSALHISPEFIKGFRDIGYTDLSSHELSGLKGVGVTPDFVAGFQKLGFDHIPARTLMQLKVRDVTSEYISKMRAQGFDSKDLMKYMRLKTDFN